jgi:hypothetical protein
MVVTHIKSLSLDGLDMILEEIGHGNSFWEKVTPNIKVEKNARVSLRDKHF